MIWDWILYISVLFVLLGCWNLAQQNALGHEPFARLIGLSYGLIGCGAAIHLFAPVLPVDLHAVPVMIAGVAINMTLTSLRLHDLYEGGQ